MNEATSTIILHSTEAVNVISTQVFLTNDSSSPLEVKSVQFDRSRDFMMIELRQTQREDTLLTLRILSTGQINPALEDSVFYSTYTVDGVTKLIKAFF